MEYNIMMMDQMKLDLMNRKKRVQNEWNHRIIRKMRMNDKKMHESKTATAGERWGTAIHAEGLALPSGFITIRKRKLLRIVLTKKRECGIIESGRNALSDVSGCNEPFTLFFIRASARFFVSGNN